MGFPDFNSADRTVLAPERRKYRRQPLQSLSYVHLDQGNGGIILNLSEGGLAVHAAMSVMEDVLPHVRLQIGQSNRWVETGARISWSGDSRRLVGIVFVDLPDESRRQIVEWLDYASAPVAPATPANLKVSTSEGSPAVMPGVTARVTSDPTSHGVFEKPALHGLSPAEPVPLPVPETTPAPAPSASTKELLAASSQYEPASRKLFQKIPRTVPALDATPLPAATLQPPLSLEPVAQRDATKPDEAAQFVGHALVGAKEAMEIAAPIPVAITSTEPITAGLFLRPTVSSASEDTFRAAFRAGAFRPDVPPRGSNSFFLALIAILAGVSLLAGWMAGRGSVGESIGRFFGAQTNASSPPANASPIVPASASPPPTDFEVIDQNDHHWLVPFDASSRRLTQVAPVPPADASNSSPAENPSSKNDLSYRVWTLSPPTTNHPSSSSAAAPEPPAPSIPSYAAPSQAFANAAPPDPAVPNIPAPIPVSTGVQQPVLMRSVTPVYPSSAKEIRASGAVRLRLRVERDGSVSNIQVISGLAVLSSAAIDAVRQWVYKPAVLDGQPVAADVEATVNFAPPQ